MSNPGPEEAGPPLPGGERHAQIAAWLRLHRRQSVLAVIAVALLLLSGLYALSIKPSPKAPLSAGPTGGGSPMAPVSPVAGGAEKIVVQWTGADGSSYRASVTSDEFRDFSNGERSRAEADLQRASDAAKARLHASLVPIFEEMQWRVTEFGSWTFDWWTSWILIGQAIRWVWEEFPRGSVFHMPDRVHARLVREIERHFEELVLQPTIVEPRLAAAAEQSRVAASAAIAEACTRHTDAVRAFILARAAKPERGNGSGAWTPVGTSEAAASFAVPCGGNDARERDTIADELQKLRTTLNVDDPVGEVILRMARPFATKLISYVVLPVIVTAIIGGIALPLLGILPNVLSGVIAGILTGAFGAAIIGFSASASVDWLLSRADERRNRGAFEVQVRRAVIASRDSLEAKIAEIERQFARRQLGPILEASLRGPTQ